MRMKQTGVKLRLLTATQASIAFEYVLVTLVGVGMSLFVMQYAKKMIASKLENFQVELDQVWEQNSMSGEGDLFDEF